MKNRKSIFYSWARLGHYLYHRLFGHKIIYEFDKNRFNGWRGDTLCRYCSYRIYSREAMRMQYFGMYRTSIGIVNEE